LDLSLPDEKEREEILQILSYDLELDQNVKFDTIANKTQGYVAGDIRGLLLKAAEYCIKENSIQIN
jgi:ATP-dependent Zn protease